MHVLLSKKSLESIEIYDKNIFWNMIKLKVQYESSQNMEAQGKYLSRLNIGRSAKLN
jgi:hypothetical protein